MRAMAAAIALAVVLVVAVAGMSLAMQSQHPTASTSSGGRPTRPPRVTPTPARRVRERRSALPPEPPAPPPAAPASAEPKVPELLRTGVPTRAKVVNVVDERVVGPVTRSRLTLQIEPEGGDGVEVVIRHAFPTPSSRAAVRIGGTVAVRYDRDDPKRVLLDPEADAGT